MFRVAGLVWTSLPFGWNVSPVIAQHCLGELIAAALSRVTGRGDTWEVFHYYDDVLVLGCSRALCQFVTGLLLADFRSRGLIISPKSATEPSQSLMWLGKSFDLGSGTIRNTEAVLLRICALCLLLSLVPLHSKVVERFTGHALWALRPHAGATLTLRPWYCYPWGTTRCLPSATGAMRASLGDTTFFALLPWRVPDRSPPPLLCPVWCVDAAGMGDGYQVGLYNPTLGGRVLTCPPPR